jgi:precorrin-6Y C5,15-methyltransferase (decarboxylating)
LKTLAGEVQIWNVAIARGIEQMDRVRFEAVNPTFLLAVTKTTEAGD